MAFAIPLEVSLKLKHYFAQFFVWLHGLDLLLLSTFWINVANIFCFLTLDSTAVTLEKTSFVFVIVLIIDRLSVNLNQTNSVDYKLD